MLTRRGTDDRWNARLGRCSAACASTRCARSQTSNGLPHTGFTLDEELSAMLTFFHSLNSILWCALTAYQTADALVLCVLLE